MTNEKRKKQYEEATKEQLIDYIFCLRDFAEDVIEELKICKAILESEGIEYDD